MVNISIQKPLDQPKGISRLLSSLRESFANEDFSSFYAVVAFAKVSPLKKLGGELSRWSTQGKSHKLIFGLDENGTSYEALAYALDNLDESYVIHGKSSFGGTFHPKIFIFKGSNAARVYIGSNNFTVGGLESNAESYICLDFVPETEAVLLNEIDNIWNETLSIAKRLDQNLLDQLKESGLALEEKSLRRIRSKTLIAAAEDKHDPALKPEFEKIRTTAAERIETVREDQDELSENWVEYGEFLERSCAEGVNLYWKVSKKNNRLEQHLWIIDYMLENGAPENSAPTNNQLVRNAANLYGGPSMEGTRALMFSKLIGFIEPAHPFTVTSAYGALHYPVRSDEDAKINSQIITNQLEKFYFWNNIFRAYDRHTGGPTAVSTQFHLYPMFFIYEVLILLHEKGYDLYSLSRFEIENFVVIAKSHDQIEEVTNHIVDYRSAENMEEIEEFLMAKSSSMDTRFYNTLGYSRYFDFSAEIVAIKQEYVDEIRTKVAKFNRLRAENRLIIFTPETSDKYRELLFSSEDLISYHF